MISHRRKFIFLHVSKTGGQSVEKALRSFALSPLQKMVRYVDIRTVRRDPFGIYQAGSHPSADEVRAAIGPDAFDSYFSFSFTRNPWDRMLSTYKFSKLRPGTSHYKAATQLNFEDFVEHQCSGQSGQRTQAALLLAPDDTPKVNFIGRFEALNEDFATVCAKLGCRATLPHKNKTAPSDYRKVYTPRAIDLVATHFASDIRAFNYSFE